MSNGKQKDLISEPTPDDAPPEELNGGVIDVPAVVDESAVPDLADDQKLQNAIATAERRFAFTEAVKKSALARTSPHHWAKYPRGDDVIFYLTGEGATNLIKGFGVQVVDQESKKLWSEDELGRYYIWVYTADVYVPVFDLHLEGIEGRCSQRKAFFAKAGQEWKPTSEIDETNIMADAQTDLWRNIIRRTFGIGYETEETIAEAKVDTSKVAAPSFKKGGRSGSGLIKAKFPSKCAACGKGIKKGEEIYYDRPNKKAYHPDCAPAENGDAKDGAADEAPAEDLSKQIKTLAGKHGVGDDELAAFVGEVYAVAVNELNANQAKELIARLESGPEKGGYADYVSEPPKGGGSK